MIACLSVPELPLVAALRAEPQLAGTPLVVVQAGSDLGGARARARHHRARCRPGQTLAEARALCPDVVVRQASAERERAAAQAAREAAGSVSPRVEEAAPGLVYLDVSGLESLIGDERMVARALVAAAERVGLCAAVGLAASKSVARLAARAAQPDLTLEPTRWGVGGGAFRVVRPEEQRDFWPRCRSRRSNCPTNCTRGAAPIRVAHAGRSGAASAGTAGGAARVRRGRALAARARRGFGRTVAAQGAGAIRGRRRAGVDASSIEPLLFVWKALLDRLAVRLSARGLMAREIYLQLRLADASWDERALDLAAAHERSAGPAAALAIDGGRPAAAGRSARGAAQRGAGARSAGADAALRRARSESDAARGGGGAAVGAGRARSGGARRRAGQLDAIRGFVGKVRAAAAALDPAGVDRGRPVAGRARAAPAADGGSALRRGGYAAFWSSARARSAAGWWRARDRGARWPNGGRTRRSRWIRTTSNWPAGC